MILRSVKAKSSGVFFRENVSIIFINCSPCSKFFLISCSISFSKAVSFIITIANENYTLIRNKICYKNFVLHFLKIRHFVCRVCFLLLDTYIVFININVPCELDFTCNQNKTTQIYDVKIENIYGGINKEESKNEASSRNIKCLARTTYLNKIQIDHSYILSLLKTIFNITS